MEIHNFISLLNIRKTPTNKINVIRLAVCIEILIRISIIHGIHFFWGM